MTPQPRKHARRSGSSAPHTWFRPEPLERRVLMAADRPPTVEGIFVSGTQWNPDFLAYLEETNNGSAQAGFEVAAGNGKGSILPWINLNEISVQFSEDVLVSPDDLEIASAIGRTYNVANLAYDSSTFTATWTLDQAIDAADILTLTLDATGADAITDTTGNALRGRGGGPSAGDVVHQLSVLPGDANRSGEVLQDDADEAFDRSFSSVNDPRVDGGFPKYSIFFDVDGSGIILAGDVGEIRRRIGTTLPA